MAGSDSVKSPPPAVFAWLVHLLTSTGAIWALLALAEILDRDWPMALLWLLVALAIDGVDGSLARWARVKTRAPRIDGEALDLIVDYLNYVFVPTVFMWRAGLIPPDLAPWLAAAIQVSSLYLFTRRDMKSPDNYFLGFPSLWNLVAFYLFVTGAGPSAGAIAVAALAALTFAPVHFVHPFRVRDYGILLPILSCLWAASACALLWPGWSPDVRQAILIASLAGASILLLMGFARTLRGPRTVGAHDPSS
ncbi:MAG TPA: CDP-alcohol phosphatidyltransferase family protein [Allosphingosinicella sp.]